MTPSSSRLTAFLLASATLAPVTGAVAQQEPLPRQQIERFTTPDGSRFVLVRDPDMAQVHWAIATWADGRDDPPGLREPGVQE